MENHNNSWEETPTTSAQDSYIDNMMEQTGMTNCNTVSAPGRMKHYLTTNNTKDTEEPLVNFNG